MASLRRFFSLIFMIMALGWLIFFLGFKAAPYWTTECEVSQVFKISRSMPLGWGAYLGSYNVAVTPLTARDKMAQICQLYTVTPVSYVDLLDKKVWLFPLEGFQFAYDETPQAGHWLFAPLLLGILSLGVSFLLFKEKANPKK